MQTALVLTVAQGKRLIAKAVVQLPEVRQAMAQGIVAIGRGTTNGYIAEELLGHTLPKGEYVAGRTLPPGMPWDSLGKNSYPDVVLRRGQRIENGNVLTATQEMQAGDVFIKGGNALNYDRKLVGILVGHPEGGTVGAVYGTVVSRKAHFIIPIGLEKLVNEDILALSRDSRRPEMHPAMPVVSLFPVTGTIITEIEAFALLCGVQARLLAAGGVGGAEGAIWLLLDGEQSALDRALELHRTLQAEPMLPLRAE